MRLKGVYFYSWPASSENSRDEAAAAVSAAAAADGTQLDKSVAQNDSQRGLGARDPVIGAEPILGGQQL
jgi:hypothetical protein